MAKSATIFGQTREFSVSAPAINSGSNIPTVQFSTGNAKALADFSRTLFGFSAQMEDQLDQQASAEAEKEGAMAGLAGETEERTYETIRGRAYNKAMLDTFVTTMDTKAVLAVAELQQQYYNDPVGLQKALDERLGGMSEELEKYAPGSGAAFYGRNVARAQPAVEAARTTRFNLTRSEAEANLITHEAMVVSQFSSNAVSLFSDNPAESAASSQAVAQAVGEYMRIYDAVDPITNKPLYSPAEKAKAEVFMREKIATEAAMGWFDAQPDKAAAYLEMSKPDFQFKMNMQGQKPANVMYANKGKTRSLPVTKAVMDKLEVAGGATGSGIAVHITSGGQVGVGEKGPRTGSTRHDHGNAADIVLSVNGKMVTPQQDPGLYERFLENAAAAGFTGIGHYGWGVHVGGGKDATWGPDTTGGTLAPNYANAVERGRARRASGPLKLEQDSQTARPLREVLGEAGFNALDARVRQSMQWANAEADRREKAEKEQVEAEQKRVENEITARIFSPPGTLDPATGQPFQPVTLDTIISAGRSGLISQPKYDAFMKNLTTDKPDQSDDAFYQELQRRMWSGEDIQDDVLNGAARLSKADSDKLLSKNDSLNVSGAGSMSTDQTYYQGQLKNLLIPTGIFADYDEGRQLRAFAALEEFRERAFATKETGETLRDITFDIAERSITETAREAGSKLETMVRPRFSVTSTEAVTIKNAGGEKVGSVDVSNIRWLDIPASAKALKANQSKMSPEAFSEQSARLQAWSKLQDEYLMEQVRLKNEENKNKRRGR